MLRSEIDYDYVFQEIDMLHDALSSTCLDSVNVYSITHLTLW